MRQLLKKMAAVLLAVCICLGIPREVRAEKMKLEEWSRIMDYTVYDCGMKTEDGIFEIQSESSLLKEGDSVDIRVLYYGGAQNAEGPLRGVTLDLFYDETVLEFQNAVIEDNVVLEYGTSLTIQDASASIEKGGWQRLTTHYNTKRVEQNICMYKISFKVIQVPQFTTVGVEPCDIIFQQGESVHTSDRYGNLNTLQEGEEEWQDRMTYTITDTSVTPSALNLSSAPAQGSKEITVPINIEKNAGFNLLGLTLDYDTSLFTYESLEIADSLKSKISLDSVYESPGSGRIKASFIALEDITDVGDFLKLKLKVKDGVPAGTTSNVEVGIDQVGNKAETSMSGTGTTCAISITDTSGGEEQQPALGDVNADQKIDLVDAVYILQNYNQVREFTQAQETAADVTKDGNVNLVDALMIMKYFNGEIAEF